MEKTIQVAILVEIDDYWGRNFVQGIMEYVKTRPDWRLLVSPRNQLDQLRLPDGWKGDGIVTRLGDPEMVEHVRKTGLPVVDTDVVVPFEPWFARVVTDNRMRDEMVFEHLRDRGLRNFAYYGPPSRRYASERGNVFIDLVEQSGKKCSVYRPGYRSLRRISWSAQQKHITRWLASLPKPVGIYAADSQCGRRLLEGCEEAQCKVPEEAAIVGGDDDVLLCGTLRPTLSCVLLAAKRAGTKVASLLDKLMHGEPLPEEPIKIEPLGVIARESSDTLAIDDPDLAQVVRIIREEATSGIDVNEVLRRVPVSRRSLEIRFREAFGRTPCMLQMGVSF